MYTPSHLAFRNRQYSCDRERDDMRFTRVKYRDGRHWLGSRREGAGEGRGASQTRVQEVVPLKRVSIGCP